MKIISGPNRTTVPQLGLVVPCFNEETRLDRWTFLRFAQTYQWLQFYFVNDGSTDGTGDLLHRMAAETTGGMQVVELSSNQGKAEAVRTGMLHACADGCRLIGFWDADLAAPLEELPRMREVMLRRDDVDAVIGSRLPLAGRRIERRRLRALLGRTFARVATSLLSIPVTDTQCGAKLFRRTDVLEEALREKFLARWVFDVELLRRCAVYAGGAWLRERTYEFPLDSWQEIAGSKVRGRDFITAGGELMRVYWRYGGRTALPESATRDRADESTGRSSRRAA